MQVKDKIDDMLSGEFVLPDTVVFDREKGILEILDQTLLPSREEYLRLCSAEETADAIAKLKVRGAPAIGVAAAFGVCVGFRKKLGSLIAGVPENEADVSPDMMDAMFREVSAIIAGSRPTAVNLSWAVDRMGRAYASGMESMLAEHGCSVRECIKITPSMAGSLIAVLEDEAVRIKEEDVEMCRNIGINGMKLIKKGYRILTHCNAGHLAVSRYGTALSPVYMAHAAGLEPKVYADETRPLLQGARLTAYELVKAGVDTTLVCDNMAASLMSSGKVDMVIVGCDRIAANGDVANKIGTCGLAVLAHHFGIPFYVAGPSSTFDPSTPSGSDIVIEERNGKEVTEMFYSCRMAPEGVDVYNPAFDVTPAELVTAYITDKGVFKGCDEFPEMASRMMEKSI